MPLWGFNSLSKLDASLLHHLHSTLHSHLRMSHQACFAPVNTRLVTVKGCGWFEIGGRACLTLKTSHTGLIQLREAGCIVSAA